jgi:phosphoserine phosphatase
MTVLESRPLPEPALAMAAGQQARHVITVVKPVISVELLGALLHRLSTVASRVTGTRTMATQPYTVLEITVALEQPVGNAEAALGVALRQLAAQCDADIAVRRAATRRSLVAFDVDSTLVCGEAINILASHSGREAEVREITKRAMHGELDFTESLRLRVGALAGLPADLLARTVADLELSPGALVAIRTLQTNRVRVGAISGGFTQVVGPLAARLGLDFHAANKLEVIDGTITGRLIDPIIDGPGKAAALKRFAASAGIPLTECVAVGDGANDIEMLTAAGLGIAYNAAPVVRAAANAVISYPRLDHVLPLLGIPVPCAVLAAA